MLLSGFVSPCAPCADSLLCVCGCVWIDASFNLLVHTARRTYRLNDSVKNWDRESVCFIASGLMGTFLNLAI